MTEQKFCCLVTGGAGFIGSHVAEELLRIFPQSVVVVLDDLSGGFIENVPVSPRVVFVKGDVTNASLVESLFEQYRFKYVFHLAAYAAEGLSHFIRRFNYTNNVVGSMSVLNAAVKYEAECFVFTSSIAVYGAGQVPFTEETTPQPEDPYGIAKYAVEVDLAAAKRLFGLDYIIFRPHNVYGERQNIGDPYRNVVGIFMRQLLSGEPMTVFGDGEQKRAFTYVKDIAHLIAESPLVERARNEIFNVGAENVYTINQLTEEVAKVLGLEKRVKYLPERSEVKVAFSDHKKCREVFGEYQETPLPEGLLKMAEWVKKVGCRKGQRFEQLELTRGLPPIWASQ